MPRSLPQTFARRLALQGIMWGLLVAAMLGAWQLSRSRDRGVQIPKLATAKGIGDLMIAVPGGWAAQGVRLGPALLVVADEPAGRPLQRELIITQQQLPAAPSDAFIADQLHNPAQVTSVNFAGLHAQGVLATEALVEERTGRVTQEFDAFVYVPQRHLAVTVEFRGVPGFGPIDRKDFQSIIDSLQLVPPAAPGKTLHDTGGRGISI